MDEHTAAGFYAKGEIPSKVRSFKGFYSIPYGCYCSKTITNLMMAGRNISASKLAMGSTRVMATCAVGGEAVGVAAANAALLGLNPKEYGKSHIKELQQKLLKNDLYIMGCKNEDPSDMALKAKIVCSSEQEGFEAVNVISGVTRRVENSSNMWKSKGISKEGEFISLKLNDILNIKEVRLTFDPDLSEERCISVSKAFLEKEPKGVAKTLVKDYDVELYKEGIQQKTITIRDNHQRLNIVRLPKIEKADEIRIKVLATNGVPDVHIYEVRIY